MAMQIARYLQSVTWNERIKIAEIEKSLTVVEIGIEQAPTSASPAALGLSFAESLEP